MKQILTIGGILAVYSTLYALALKYVFPPGIVLSSKGMLINFFLGIFLLVFLGRKFLRPEHPSLDYGQALKYLFPAALLAYTIGLILQIGFFQNDQKMKDASVEFNIATIEKTMDMVGSMTGQSDAEIAIEKNKAIEEVKANADRDYGFQWNKFPMLLFTGMITTLINTLIASIFVKVKSSGSA
jgi:hypothetical protein